MVSNETAEPKVEMNGPKELPWPWYVVLLFAAATGLVLLDYSQPFPWPTMLSRVRPDAWWRLFGVLILSGVVSHLVVAPTLCGLDWLFGLDANRERKNLWPPAVLGLFEAILYPCAWLLQRPDFIGVWLLLKVAGQWPRWGLGGGSAEALNEGRRRYTRFLIGNLLMLFIGALTYGLIKASLLE